MSTFCVYGSHGDLVVASMSGRVLEYHPIGEGEYSAVAFFNVAEWRQAYPGNIPDHIDILDIGYWTQEGEYAPSVEDWRKDKGGFA